MNKWDDLIMLILKHIGDKSDIEEARFQKLIFALAEAPPNDKTYLVNTLASIASDNSYDIVKRTLAILFLRGAARSLRLNDNSTACSALISILFTEQGEKMDPTIKDSITNYEMNYWYCKPSLRLMTETIQLLCAIDSEDGKRMARAVADKYRCFVIEIEKSLANSNNASIPTC